MGGPAAAHRLPLPLELESCRIPLFRWDVRCAAQPQACGLSGARWVSRMRQSDVGGSGTGMEKGGCLYPCARRDQSLEHAQHDDYLALRLSEGRISVGTRRAVGSQRNTSGQRPWAVRRAHRLHSTKVTQRGATSRSPVRRTRYRDRRL